MALRATALSKGVWMSSATIGVRGTMISRAVSSFRSMTFWSISLLTASTAPDCSAASTTYSTSFSVISPTCSWLRSASQRRIVLPTSAIGNAKGASSHPMGRTQPSACGAICRARCRPMATATSVSSP